MASREIRCELSWSTSRQREWERCPREAWYARYASWGWWTERPRGERWRAMVLKNLTSLPAFAGDCMHRAIAAWFEQRRARGRGEDARWLFARARDQFRDGWRESNGGGWEARPNKRVHLLEHHYGHELPPERTDAVRDLLERSAAYFCEAPELEAVRASDPADWRALEELDSFEHAGVQVYAMPDFVHAEAGALHVWDWKTGRPRDEDAFQLATYALYAVRKWRVDPERIELHAAYLGAGEVRDSRVDAESLEATAAAIERGIESLRAAHYDPDREPARLELFPARPAPSRCGSCRFLEVCPEAAAARPEGATS